LVDSVKAPCSCAAHRLTGNDITGVTGSATATGIKTPSLFPGSKLCRHNEASTTVEITVPPPGTQPHKQRPVGVKIHLIDSEQELFALRNDWDLLPCPSPMTSSRWLLTWWEQVGSRPTRLEGRSKPFTLAVYDRRQQLVGLAPWYLRTYPSGHRRIQNLGNGATSSDHQSILCRPGLQNEVVAAIAEHLLGPLAGRWDELDLDGIDAADPCMQQLIAHLTQSTDCFSSVKSHLSTWQVDLPSDWDNLLAGLSRNHRKRILRLDRKYIRTGRATIQWVDSPTQLDAAFKTWLGFHRLRHDALEQKSGILQSQQTVSFHHQVMEELLAVDQLRLSIMYLDGRPAAADYALRDETTVYAYQCGFDPNLSEHSPGVLSLILAIQTAIAQGCHRFDMLRGDQPYKKSWCQCGTPQLRLRIRRNHLRGRTLHLTHLAYGALRTALSATPTSG
jgi:CelD/BcsL family acetyltransferase involved in cellulose biosynthesis